jgi:hypothetical protein
LESDKDAQGLGREWRNLRSKINRVKIIDGPGSVAIEPLWALPHDLKRCGATWASLAIERWWSRRESNPRPQVFIGQIYMRS